MTWEEFCVATLPNPATISVEAYTGSGAYGDVYAAAVNVYPCVIDARRRRVRVAIQDAAGGEVISSTTVYGPPGTTAPPGSRVTLPDGTVSKVLAAAVREAHGLPLPEHVELNLE